MLPNDTRAFKMLEILQRSRSNNYQISAANLVMAMDFDSGWTDLAKPSRTLTVPSDGSVTLSTAAKINGGQSYLQTQTYGGSAGILSTPVTSDLLFAGDFWVEMWGYCLGWGSVTYTGGSNYLFSYGKYTSTGYNALWLNYNNLYFSVPSGTSGSVIASSGAIVTNNAWHHFAVGRKNGVLYLFVDGNLVASVAYTGTFGFDNILTIGGLYDARIGGKSYAGFNGYIDRIRVYNACAATRSFTPLRTAYPN